MVALDLHISPSASSFQQGNVGSHLTSCSQLIMRTLQQLLLLSLALLSERATAHTWQHGPRPNIVLVMTDDQDRRLGSMQYQAVVQDEIIAKGTEFTNHFGTVAQCCPARASIFRGQAAHNTNITHVGAPGGNYDKWTMSGEDQDYLPFWLKKAGYRTECKYFPSPKPWNVAQFLMKTPDIGKFLNGYTTNNYHTTPKGWDHVDALVG